MRASIPKVITTSAAADLLMLSRQRLYQLETAGRIKRVAPDKWCTVDIVKNYIRFLRENAGTDNSAANSRLRDARASEIELRVTERLGTLCPIEDFAAFVDLICGAFRTELDGLPARITRDLPMRHTIEREINGVLTRVADICAANASRMERPQE